MFRLDNKVALVTGASGGIGGEIARALHAMGAKVVLSGRKEAELAALKDSLGDNAFVITADLSKPDAADALVEQAEKLCGQVDILVNNAGLTRDGLAMRMKDEDWQAVIDVNLTACFRLARAAVRGMLKRRQGRIINITSVVGIMGNAGQVNYAASKGGLTAFSKSLARETASRGVTVNCIAPGFIKTAMTDAIPEKERENLASHIPAGRLGVPADVAAAAAFLASDEAGYITGETVNVNGGMLMV
ncbi:MAG: 3-oxoacyl-[acyl-carrier-protein] reductase [Alphaproteobacteria bacterium]|nr:3-oxoacyl-[acyl-carrier-protein] reductase [Alphaproteobacteria bacterium]